MGLFSKKEDCFVCGGKSNIKILDGAICTECRDKSIGYLPEMIWSPKQYSKQQVRTAINRREKDFEFLSIFNETRSIADKLYIDETNKLWYIPRVGLNGTHIKPPIIHKFEDILNFELQENGTTVAKGGLGSAIVGGALFGSTGAIVGAVAGCKNTDIIDTVRINVTVNDMLKPNMSINLLPDKAKRNSAMYGKAMTDAQNILALLSIMVEQVKAETNTNTIAPVSVADEIRKFKELLDMGAITQEEFDTKKKELLG